MNTAGIALVAVALWTAPIDMVFAQSRAAQLRIGFEMPSDHILHQPVIAMMTVTNQSSVPAQVDLGWNRVGNIHLEVRRRDGSVSVAPRRRSSGGLSRAGRITIEPGQAYRQQVVLNEWLSFDTPGRYQLALGLESGVNAAGQVAWVAAPVRFDLVVSDRDENRLREIFHVLAEQATGAADAVARADAVQALASVDDPIAVPYLEDVFRATNSIGVDSLVVDSLLRIGTPEAQAALFELASSPDRHRAALGSDALNRFTKRAR